MAAGRGQGRAGSPVGQDQQRKDVGSDGARGVQRSVEEGESGQRKEEDQHPVHRLSSYMKRKMDEMKQQQKGSCDLITSPKCLNENNTQTLETIEKRVKLVLLEKRSVTAELCQEAETDFRL